MRKTGYVQFVDGNKITVDGEKYSAFAASQIQCRVGDFVDFEYIEKPSVTRAGTPVVYKNIKGNVVPGAGGAATAAGTASPPRGFTPPPTKVGEPILAKDRLILRQNALTAAVNYCNILVGSLPSNTGEEPSPELVVEIAKKFEYYTSGDMDYDAAEKALEGDKVD